MCCTRPLPEFPGFVGRLQRLEREEHAGGKPAPAGQTTTDQCSAYSLILEVPDAHVVERTPRLKHDAPDHQPGGAGTRTG